MNTRISRFCLLAVISIFGSSVSGQPSGTLCVVNEPCGGSDQNPCFTCGNITNPAPQCPIIVIENHECHNILSAICGSSQTEASHRICKYKTQTYVEGQCVPDQIDQTTGFDCERAVGLPCGDCES